MQKHIQGFTLIELMIAIAIVAILAAIAIPAYENYIGTKSSLIQIQGNSAEAKAQRWMAKMRPDLKRIIAINCVSDTSSLKSCDISAKDAGSQIQMVSLLCAVEGASYTEGCKIKVPGY